MEENLIKYPLLWEYLIVCENVSTLFKAIEAKFGGLEYTLKDSKQSKNAKYTSHSFTIMVVSQAQRDEIFGILKGIDGVKFVL